MKNYLTYTFESSCYKTPEFKSFARKYKNAIKKALGPDYEIIDWLTGHFFTSAFIKKNTTGKLIYISCSDVRYFRNQWYNNILIRTAAHNKDYTGGYNHYTTLDHIKNSAAMLT